MFDGQLYRIVKVVIIKTARYVILIGIAVFSTYIY